MGYLYLNFVDNLETGLGSKSWGREDFYTESLNDQYEKIKSKLGNSTPENLQIFIATIFIYASKKIYISLPGFDRSIKTDNHKRQYINNIVIRPARDEFSATIMPKNYDIILIGNVTFGKVIDITIKGIELIDVNVAKFGEKELYCDVACAFSNKSFSLNGNIITVPDYGVSDVHDSVLTFDFVNALCKEVYPVENPQEALNTFDDWQKYIKFRKYYLDKQSEKCQEITAVDVRDSYMISGDIYRQKKDDYEQFLLDGIEKFAKGEQVILSKEVTGAESFPLICVQIDRNRKGDLSVTTGKNGKGKPKFEADLNRYTLNTMGLSDNAPRYENGNLAKSSRFYQYILGERYLFDYVDIEPDCKEIEDKCDKDIKAAENDVDNKYTAIISSEVNRFMHEQESIILEKYNNQIDEYVLALKNELEKDVRENKDENVQNEYDKHIQNILKPLKIEYDNERKILEQKIAKLKKEKNEQNILDLQTKLADLKQEYEENCAYAVQYVNIRDFYIERNEKLIEIKRTSLDIALNSELAQLKKDKELQLKLQYKETIRAEKEAQRKEIEQKYNIEKYLKIENETIRRYCIYFRPDDITKEVKYLRKEISEMDTRFLTYDNRAEKAKIERQEKALISFKGGYVKNPYLPTYLFAPQSLGQMSRAVEDEPDWCLESLNDRQKLAVKRALTSESLFLLQGPPGTGKTQVIAEITAQLCRRGKKVLISSETHKAIDNVFERLPKIPEIRPLRLIPSQNKKETNYSPEKLVDNFYLNISRNLEKQINRFEHFEETKDTFSDTMKKLRLDYDRVLKLKRQLWQVEHERQEIYANINKLNDELDNLRSEMSVIKEEMSQFQRTIKYIDIFKFVGEDVKAYYLEDFANDIEKLLKKYDCLKEVAKDKVIDIVKLDVPIIKQDIENLLYEEKLVKLKNRQKKLREILSNLRDPETDEAPQVGNDNFAEYQKYQKELISVGKSIKEVQAQSQVDISGNIVIKFFPHIANDKSRLNKLPDELCIFKVEVQKLVGEYKDKITTDMNVVLSKQTEIECLIDDKKVEISRAKGKYEEISANDLYVEYSELNSALKQKISRFIRDFDIIREYNSNDMEEAFEVISDEWKKLENDYKATQAENKTKIPMYNGICKYLEQSDILEEDRQTYTRALFDNVNVFGITCTSRDRFTKSQLEELGRYGIDDINIRTQGIDVVIVDEVSKSSFLDLLIPILYGKTVILVGDHRQLPPMYDLRNMKKDDFEGLDENIITKEINDKYTALYEECFFKKLYEEVPDDFRVMLNKQYRCHSHIMEVFNHFYGGSSKGLMVGTKQQDNDKQHNLTMRIGGNTIIDPEHHIYFVDCDKYEDRAYEGSRSKINEQEAQVAIELLRQLDNASGEQVRTGKFQINTEKRIDERPSVGIICAYGDQAGIIKKKRKGKQYKNFSNKQDENLIISTVDDFQGDERDIIILSMVRHPRPGKRFDLDFLRKFERINVALSRARKLLIVLGAKQFLSDNGIIDLPDMEGNHSADKLNFHVYKEIIDTIYFKGKIIPARDIIGEDNGK